MANAKTTKKAAMKVVVFKENDTWNWKLTAANGKVLAFSPEGYNRRSRCVEVATRIASSQELVVQD